MCSPLIYRLQVEKSSHSVKFTFLYKPVNYFIDYKFKLKINGSSLFPMDNMIFNSRPDWVYEDIVRISTQNNENPNKHCIFLIISKSVRTSSLKAVETYQLQRLSHWDCHIKKYLAFSLSEI